MAELIKVAEKDSDLFPSLVNGIALTIATASLAFAVASHQENDRFSAEFNATIAFVSSSIAEFVNRQTKSEVAIAQMVKDSEIELSAHNVQAQKKAQIANLSIATQKRSAELKVSSAHIQAKQQVQLAQLEAEIEDSLYQLQEAEDHEEQPLQVVVERTVSSLPFLSKTIKTNQEK